MTTTKIGCQARCCHLTLRMSLTHLNPLPKHASQPNADAVADFPSLRTRSKRPIPDEDDDDSVKKNAEAETKRQRIHLAAALYSYYWTLDDEGDEIDWDQLSDEEFESKMEKLKVKERERIWHWDIAL
jgi:hypothetical protein